MVRVKPSAELRARRCKIGAALPTTAARPAWRWPLHDAKLPHRSCHMIGDQFGHLEHADAVLAVEHELEAFVGFDEGLVFRVLQVVAADVCPKFTCDFGARHRLVADDGS